MEDVKIVDIDDCPSYENYVEVDDVFVSGNKKYKELSEEELADRFEEYYTRLAGDVNMTIIALLVAAHPESLPTMDEIRIVFEKSDSFKGSLDMVNKIVNEMVERDMLEKVEYKGNTFYSHTTTFNKFMEEDKFLNDLENIKQAFLNQQGLEEVEEELELERP